MLQSALFDGVAFDPFAFEQDGVAASEVDVGRGQVADAFVISTMIVVFDEDCDLPLKVLREVVVFEQNAVLQRLVPALDFALGWGMARCTMTLFDGALFQPFAEVGGDVARAIVGKQTRLVLDPCRPQPDAVSARFRVSVTSSTFMVVHSFQATI